MSRQYPELNSEALDFRVASELFAPYKKLTPNGLEDTPGHVGAPGTPSPDDRWIAAVWKGPVLAISGRLDSSRAVFGKQQGTIDRLLRRTLLLARRRRGSDRLRTKTFDG